MVDVFISYSRKDKVFARRLFEALVATGRDAWADWEGIPYSTDWWREICRGIEESNVFVFIISPDSLSSGICNKEIAYARENHKRIIPIVRREPDSKVLAGEWFGKDWEDIARTNWKELNKLNFIFFRKKAGFECEYDEITREVTNPDCDAKKTDADDFDQSFANLINAAEEDLEHLRFHTESLRQAKEWEKSGKQDISLLVRGNSLRQSENWLTFNSSKNPSPTQLHYEFIQASLVQREHEETKEQQQRRRLQTLALILSVSLIVAIALSFFAFNQTQVVQERGTAVAKQAGTATHALGLSEQRGTEVVNQVTAVAQQAATATVAQGQAERRSEQYQSLALAANAQQALSAGMTDLALALGLEANFIDNPPVAAQRFLGEIAYSPGTKLLIEANAGGVFQVAFSPDGSMIAATTDNGGVRLWNAQTGELISVFLEENYHPYGIAFSPDGQQLAVSNIDETDSYGVLKLLDVNTGEEIASWESFDREGIISIRYTPDGQYILSGSITEGEDYSQSVILWDVQTGEKVRAFEHPTDTIFTVDVSPDGKLGLSGGADGVAIVWDLATGEEIRRFELPQIESPDSNSPVTYIMDIARFSPDGATVIIDWYNKYEPLDREVSLFDLSTGEELQLFSGHDNDPLCASFSPNGNYLVTATPSGTLYIWEVSTGQILQKLEGHKDWVRSVSFSPDGRYVASASRDDTIRIWDVEPNNAQVFDLHTARVSSAEFSTDGSYLLSADWNGILRLWDTNTWQETQRLKSGFFVNIVDADISPDGNMIVSTAGNNLYVWDVLTGQELGWLGLEGHPFPIVSVTLGSDGQQGVSASMRFPGEAGSSEVVMWDFDKMEALFTISKDADSFYATAISPDNKLILTSSASQNVQGTISYSVTLWDAHSGELIKDIITSHSDSILALAFTPDGRYFLSGSIDSTIKLWDVETGEEVQTFLGNLNAILALEVSPDGSLVATGSEDGAIYLWDIETGQKMRSFLGHTAGVWGLDFSPDGQLLASGAADGTLRIWTVSQPLDDLKTWIYQNRYVYELTCPERILYSVTPLCDNDGNLPPPIPTPIEIAPLETVHDADSIEQHDLPAPTSSYQRVYSEGIVSSYSGRPEAWQFLGKAGDIISVEMISPDFDTYLIVLDPNNNLVASDDDSGINLSALITNYILQVDGIYTILSDCYSKGEGNYTISFKLYAQETHISFNLTQTAIGLLGIAWGEGRPSDYPVVSFVVENSAAEEAGLQSDDVMLAINGESAYGITDRELFNLIRRLPGKRFELTLKREGEENLVVEVVSR